MNRLYFIAPAFLLACSTSEVAPEETEAGLSAGPTVRILSSEEGKHISLYAVRYDEEGNPSYIGSRIRHAKVTDGEAVITLPARAARRDKDPVSPDSPVNYVAFAHDSDEGGSPDDFYGVSAEIISYYNGKDGSGKSGWYVVGTDEDGEIDFARTDKVVSVDSTIAPRLSGEVFGTRGYLDLKAKVALVTDEGPVEGEYRGFKDDGTFRLTFNDEPAVTQEYEDGTRYQVMNVVAFGDEDLDGKWGAEEVAVGNVCYGLNEIFVTWREAAQSPEQAIMLSRSHTHTGWQTWASTEEGSFAIGSIELKAQESCDTMINEEIIEEVEGD